MVYVHIWTFVNYESHVPTVGVFERWSLTLIYVASHMYPKGQANRCRPSDDHDRGSIKHVTQAKPRHDCNTRNTSNRHHPLYLSFP